MSQHYNDLLTALGVAPTPGVDVAQLPERCPQCTTDMVRGSFDDPAVGPCFQRFIPVRGRAHYVCPVRLAATKLAVRDDAGQTNRTFQGARFTRVVCDSCDHVHWEAP